MFRPATPDDVAVLASWILSPRDCEFWAGPDFPFPASLETFVEKLQVRSTTSVCLIEESVVAFGQLADKGDGRAHLGKIIVAPTARKKGYGQQLVRELLRIAANRGFRIVGLNVQTENRAATRMYERLGFVFAERPSHLTPSPEAYYMEFKL
ncbi:MAG: GNAT family N-acetyltransferase [Steroidobacteraceae bacterium]